MALVLAALAATQDGLAPQIATGRVLLRGEHGDTPRAGVWVTLHRVGNDSAGPMDSTRTDALGRYRFSFRLNGDPAATYIATAAFGGVQYFAPAMSRDGSPVDQVLSVFDTTSAPIPIRTLGRHLVIAPPQSDGRREVVEIFEITNEQTKTRVAGPNDRATFRVPLPAEAIEAGAGREGDIAPAATAVRDGALLVFAPLAPGLPRQLTLRYLLPPSATIFRRTLDDSVGTLEILVAEATATLTEPRLKPDRAALVDGREFARWTSTEVSSGTRLEVRLPYVKPESATPRVRWFPIMGVLVVGMGLAALAVRQRDARR